MAGFGSFDEIGSWPTKKRPAIVTPDGRIYRFVGNLLTLTSSEDNHILPDTFSRSENRVNLYANLRLRGMVILCGPGPSHQFYQKLLEPFALYRRQELTVAEVSQPEDYLNGNYPELFGFEHPRLEDPTILKPDAMHQLVGKAIRETGLNDRLLELHLA